MYALISDFTTGTLSVVGMSAYAEDIVKHNETGTEDEAVIFVDLVDCDFPRSGIVVVSTSGRMLARRSQAFLD